MLNLKDSDYPMNISTSGDDQNTEKAMSQIKFDPTGRIGEPIEVFITLYTDELLRLAADPDAISIQIYDFDWRNKCTQKVISDLYPGSFIAQILCTGQSTTEGSKFEFLPVYNTSKNEQQRLSSERLAIDIFQQVASNASAEFYAYEGYVFNLNDEQRHAEFQFSLIDRYENILFSTQLASLGTFDGSTLLDATYTLIHANHVDEAKVIV